ncbi:MAG: HNH endonuclease [Ruminococcus sp.]|nr:HNH endonuclease [Ruminococcus sp.]MCD7800671.1 HNH endonuclease [Ruminococcus sp.]
MMLYKYCQRCGKLLEYGSKCDCVPEIKSKKYYKRKYNKVYTKFYNSKEWRMLSARYMSDKMYTCELCGKIATNVHHKIPIQLDWSKCLDYNNLMALCVSCHNKQHNKGVY